MVPLRSTTGYFLRSLREPDEGWMAGSVRGAELTTRVLGWYQFSREANSEGLRRAWGRAR